MKLFVGIIKPRPPPSPGGKGFPHKEPAGTGCSQLPPGKGWGAALHLGRRENRSLALQPRPGPQRVRLCIPGTGSAGVSSHRGHRWHTSWHRSSGRVSGSDSGSGAQGPWRQLNLNYREKQAELQRCFFFFFLIYFIFGCIGSSLLRAGFL